jgi:hypothetical protein
MAEARTHRSKHEGADAGEAAPLAPDTAADIVNAGVKPDGYDEVLKR